MSGNRIRELRQSKKLTQEEFASIFGITQQNVSRMEREEGDIPTDLLIQISKYFDVTIDYILKMSDYKHPISRIENLEKEDEKDYELLYKYRGLKEGYQYQIREFIEYMRDKQKKEEEK